MADQGLSSQRLALLRVQGEAGPGQKSASLLGALPPVLATVFLNPEPGALEAGCVPGWGGAGLHGGPCLFWDSAKAFSWVTPERHWGGLGQRRERAWPHHRGSPSPRSRRVSRQPASSRVWRCAPPPPSLGQLHSPGSLTLSPLFTHWDPTHLFRSCLRALHPAPPHTPRDGLPWFLARPHGCRVLRSQPSWRRTRLSH